MQTQYLSYQLWIKKASWIGYNLKPKGKTTFQIQRAFVKGGNIWTIHWCQKLSLQLHLHHTDLVGSHKKNEKAKKIIGHTLFVVLLREKGDWPAQFTDYLQRKSRNYFFGSCFVNKDTVPQVSHKVTHRWETRIKAFILVYWIIIVKPLSVCFHHSNQNQSFIVIVCSQISVLIFFFFITKTFSKLSDCWSEQNKLPCLPILYPINSMQWIERTLLI